MNRKIAQIIDHTNLKAQATEEDIQTLCKEAIDHQFATVCINPCYVPQAAYLLQNTKVGITTVVGFPLGAMTSMAKAYEAKEAVEFGATEIDMVMNIGALKDGKDDYIAYEIALVIEEAKQANPDVIVKVIIETCLLTRDEIIKACELSVQAGADYVKTSTGFSSGGARVEDVTLMREVVGLDIGIKAAGGIKTYKDAQAMIDAGATRIGSSGSVDMATQD